MGLLTHLCVTALLRLVCAYTNSTSAPALSSSSTHTSPSTISTPPPCPAAGSMPAAFTPSRTRARTGIPCTAASKRLSLSRHDDAFSAHEVAIQCSCPVQSRAVLLLDTCIGGVAGIAAAGLHMRHATAPVQLLHNSCCRHYSCTPASLACAASCCTTALPTPPVAPATSTFRPWATKQEDARQLVWAACRGAAQNAMPPLQAARPDGPAFRS